MDMSAEMPPMDMNMEDGMGAEIPPMNNDMEGADGNGLPSDFDSNFDAGVEADEESDPKTFIQQLTGKLSQSLNSYNNENGEPDVELGKYVLGMLVKQGTKGMDEKDKKEIIKKINTDNSEDEELNDIPEETPENTEEDDNITMESKSFKFTKKQLFENFGLSIDDNMVKKEPKIDTNISSDTIKNRRTKPFEAPKKFKE